MAFGNMCGVEAYGKVFSLISDQNYQGSILAEIEGEVADDYPADLRSWVIAGRTLEKPIVRIIQEQSSPEDDEEPTDPAASPGVAELPLAVLRRAYEYPLSQVYPQTSTGATVAETHFTPQPATQTHHPVPSQGNLKSRFFSKAQPLVIIPVFPGTICEWDLEQAFQEAGGQTRIVVFRNRSRDDIENSLKELRAAFEKAQIITFSGGFGAGDEPDGSGRFITNVIRSPVIKAALMEFYEQRDGLILGIGNGFQALLKTGLLPYGGFQNGCFQNNRPFLTLNTLGRHVSRMVRTRVMSAKSPWLSLEEPGAIHVVPVSHGEGRLVIEKEEADALFSAGQVPFCYVDSHGDPAVSEPDNPNGSAFGIESLCSPDGRILGKMGRSERAGEFVHVNIPGNKKQRIFEAAVNYFRR
jgi:phosphoribosylformylglycinamidine synthase